MCIVVTGYRCNMRTVAESVGLRRLTGHGAAAGFCLGCQRAIRFWHAQCYGFSVPFVLLITRDTIMVVGRTSRSWFLSLHGRKLGGAIARLTASVGLAFCYLFVSCAVGLWHTCAPESVGRGSSLAGHGCRECCSDSGRVRSATRSERPWSGECAACVFVRANYAPVPEPGVDLTFSFPGDAKFCSFETVAPGSFFRFLFQIRAPPVC